LDQFFNPDTTTYAATLPYGTKTVRPIAVASADGQTITGAVAVDVSSGSGVSTIVVKSIDGTATKTYTVNYKVLTSAAFAVATYAADSAGVNFKLGQGVLRLQVCNDKIIQVSYSLNSILPKKDTIMVNKVWGKSDFTVTEDADNVMISTKSLTVNVSKTTALVSYFNKMADLV
jgi:hypothetical protein